MRPVARQHRRRVFDCGRRLTSFGRVAERVVSSGVELRLPSDPSERDEQHAVPPADVIPVVAQVFAEVEDGARRYRVRGTTVLSSGYGIAPSSDPTTALARIAYETREKYLGDLLGDLPAISVPAR